MRNSNSKTWLKPGTRQCLLRRALIKSMGYTDADLERPIVGIINTWAETNPGHYNFRQMADAVKRGVWAAGGFPLEVNTMSICEVFFDISSLIFRNLLSMTTEELIERHPFDGVVLMGSCDKNVPAQLMAAVSANKPAIYLPGGPMLPGNYRGESLACGTDSFKLWTKYLAGELKEEDLSNVEGCLYGSVGACPIMGTANSMQCATESLGLSLPGSAGAPAVSAEKFRIAEMTGRRIVGMIQENLRVRDIVTREALENCITVLMASELDLPEKRTRNIILRADRIVVFGQHRTPLPCYFTNDAPLRKASRLTESSASSAKVSFRSCSQMASSSRRWTFRAPSIARFMLRPGSYSPNIDGESTIPSGLIRWRKTST